MINRDSLINYHRTLNNLFEEELMKNEKIQMIIFSSLRTIYILAYTYFVILVVVIFAFFGSTYIFIIHNLLYLHLTTNYTLPLSRGVGWFWPIPHNFLSSKCVDIFKRKKIFALTKNNYRKTITSPILYRVSKWLNNMKYLWYMIVCDKWLLSRSI